MSTVHSTSPQSHNVAPRISERSESIGVRKRDNVEHSIHLSYRVWLGELGDGDGDGAAGVHLHLTFTTLATFNVVSLCFSICRTWLHQLPSKTMH